jgi:hypothetical protein
MSIGEDVGLGHHEVAEDSLGWEGAPVDFGGRGFNDDAASAVRLLSNHCGRRSCEVRAAA